MHRIIKNEFLKLFKEKKFYIFTLLTVILGIGMLLISKMLMKVELDYIGSLGNYSMGIAAILNYWIIIILPDIITEENKAGTMKLSLISTITRTEYLASKLVFTFLTLVLIVIINFGVGVIFSGTLYGFGTIMENLAILSRYLLIVIPALGFGGIIMIPALMMASGGTVIFAGIGIMTLLNSLSMYYKWLGDYNINNFISQILTGEKIMHSIMVSCAYIVVGTLISLVIFRNKDIRN